MRSIKVRSFSFGFIPGFMLGLEFPDVDKKGDFVFLLDLGIFRVIYESWLENI